MTIGEKLKTLREEHKMTLEDVASSIGVGRATVFKYENGIITNIPLDKIELLSKLFSVSPAYLMGWEERKHPVAPREPVTTSEAIIISGGIDKMPKERRQQAMKILQAAFADYAELFKEEDI